MKNTVRTGKGKHKIKKLVSLIRRFVLFSRPGLSTGKKFSDEHDW